jgi:manganese transport system ATP-binding protein
MVLATIDGVKSALTVRNLSIRYGDTVALDAVSGEIPTGTATAIIGANGSGKSTLLKAVAGISSPSSGHVDLHGHSTAIVLQLTEADRAVPLTVRDTVTMGRYPHAGLLGRLSRTDRRAVADAVDAMDLKGLLGRQIHHLSGGQRQRTFVAQGLAQQADVLLLDEPLTGLDVVSQDRIAHALEQIRAREGTTVFTTHSFAEAEAADLVMLLATRCIAFGPPETVLTEDNLRQAFGGRLLNVGGSLILDDPHHDPQHAH